MTLTTICVIAATIIYVAYNAMALIYFGVPESLSKTYYLLKDRWNVGYLFTLMMFSVVFFMMPAWINLSEGSNFQFLAFLAPASIAFVGAAPAFLSSDLQGKVHTAAAILAAICSLAWVCVVTPYWVAILIYVVFEGAKAFFSKTYKTCFVYWLEQVAFLSTFTAAIVHSL